MNELFKHLSLSLYISLYEQEVIAIDVAYLIRPPHLRVSLFQRSKQEERPSSEQSVNHTQPLLQTLSGYQLGTCAAGMQRCFVGVLLLNFPISVQTSVLHPWP